MNRHRFTTTIFVAVAVALAAATATAKVQPAQIFCDHMVLQRDKTVPVWGVAEAGEKVTVAFVGQSKSATTGADGKWMVRLDPLAASAKPRTLTISSPAGTITIADVLVGDVWLCSGQSNMGRNVSASAIPEGMKWSHPTIRYWGAGKDEPYPVERYESPTTPWKVCGDEESTKGCCAVGFFFARRIQQDVDVPIGIL